MPLIFKWPGQKERSGPALPNAADSKTPASKKTGLVTVRLGSANPNRTRAFKAILRIPRKPPPPLAVKKNTIFPFDQY